jgi:hypothetical protein
LYSRKREEAQHQQLNLQRQALELPLMMTMIMMTDFNEEK